MGWAIQIEPGYDVLPGFPQFTRYPIWYCNKTINKKPPWTQLQCTIVPFVLADLDFGPISPISKWVNIWL